MELKDLYRMKVTKNNVSALASIALDMKLSADNPLRKNIKSWYEENGPGKDSEQKRLNYIRDLLKRGYSITAISKDAHIAPITLKRLIQDGKLRKK